MLFGIREDRQEILKRGYKSVSGKSGIVLCNFLGEEGSKRVDDTDVEWLLKQDNEQISFLDLSKFSFRKGSIN